jgi:hypothetical protein
MQMDVQGRDVDSFVKDANAAIEAKVKMPTGYWVEWGGAFENQQRAMAKLGVIVPLTIGLIFILLYTAFNSVTPCHADHRQRAVRDHRRHRRVVRHRAVPVGALGDRLHRRVRGGDAQRHRAGEFPQ